MTASDRVRAVGRERSWTSAGSTPRRQSRHEIDLQAEAAAAIRDHRASESDRCRRRSHPVARRQGVLTSAASQAPVPDAGKAATGPVVPEPGLRPLRTARASVANSGPREVVDRGGRERPPGLGRGHWSAGDLREVASRCGSSSGPWLRSGQGHAPGRVRRRTAAVTAVPDPGSPELAAALGPPPCVGRSGSTPGPVRCSPGTPACTRSSRSGWSSTRSPMTLPRRSRSRRRVRRAGPSARGGHQPGRADGGARRRARPLPPSARHRGDRP